MDVPTPTITSPPDSSLQSDSFPATGTSSSPSSTSDGFPVFPNSAYVQLFYLNNPKPTPGILDIDLYNDCYLPFNPLPYPNYLEKRAVTVSIQNPDYQIEEAPCKRQAAINANCYFDNTNGTFSGLQVSEKWATQQQCYCEKYPFFDSAAGCQQCFLKHGGIEGYHWFPQSYLDDVSSSYCAASPATTGFYPFVSQWAKTNSAAKVPTSTAGNVLGTMTAASLYYTPGAGATSASPSHGAAAIGAGLSSGQVGLGFLASLVMGII